MIELATAIGRTARTEALWDGRVTSPLLRLALADVPVISRAFAPMVRTEAFAVSELALATFLQARAYGKPLVLLPVVLAGRFQEAALLTRTEGGVDGPADLRGRRVGVRAYSQTTGMWLRGPLAELHGVPADSIRWVTFEDAHVAEVRDPPWAERAPQGSDMLTMLREGALDAAIFGNDVPEAPWLRPVFADPAAAGAAFRDRYGLMPVNHMLTVRSDLAPALMVELVRMFSAASGASPLARAALQPALELALRFAGDQGLLPRPLSLADVWDGLPEEIP